MRYSLYWEVAERSGNVPLQASVEFVFGLRAALATMHANESTIKLPEYYGVNDIEGIMLQFTADAVTPSMVNAEANLLEGNDVLNIYCDDLIVHEHEFSKIFDDLRIPPNTAVVSDPDEVLEPITLISESEPCDYIIELGRRDQEGGFNIIGIPNKFKVDGFVQGFTFLHKQIALAHAITNNMRVSNIDESQRTVLYLSQVAPQTVLRTSYITNGSTIEGLNILKRERLSYY